MWSLCHRGKLSIFSSGIHSSLPSGESINAPLKSFVVKTKTYQSLPLNFGNRSKPQSFGLRMDNPDSSYTSRITHSSGVSPASNLPPSPFHLPSWISLSFLLRCSRFNENAVHNCNLITQCGGSESPTPLLLRRSHLSFSKTFTPTSF
jgi:hypothetical protein